LFFAKHPLLLFIGWTEARRACSPNARANSRRRLPSPYAVVEGAYICRHGLLAAGSEDAILLFHFVLCYFVICSELLLQSLSRHLVSLSLPKKECFSSSD
jgi:hypothetical protein